MGEWLYQKFLDEGVEDLQKALLLHGVDGLLGEFETWLRLNDHIVMADEKENTK